MSETADRKLTLIMREIYMRREAKRIMLGREQTLCNRIEAIIFNEPLPGCENLGNPTRNFYGSTIYGDDTEVESS